MEPHEPLTAALLREFVLTIDLKLEQFRTEMRTEFGIVHATLARLEVTAQAHGSRLDRLDHRLDQLESRLDRITDRLLFTALTAGVALAVSLFVLLR